MLYNIIRVPYYTDEQRRRAKSTQRIKAAYKKYKDGMIEFDDYFRIQMDEQFSNSGLNIKMPINQKPKSKPKKADYGLPDDIEETIKRLDAQANAKKRQMQKELIDSRTLTFKIVVSIIFVVSMGLIAISGENWFNTAIALASIGFFLIIPFGAWAYDDNPDVPAVKLPGMKESYDEYRRDLHDWEYWERRRTRTHWNNLSGYKFEHEMASLFRLAGFDAQVTKASGDGGIDIILTKGTKKIAVQCKRYEKGVTVHVIRDLYGTMAYNGYREGCIATTSYFTSGVKEFADKTNIVLIGIDDILAILVDGGIEHLKKKMHV